MHVNTNELSVADDGCVVCSCVLRHRRKEREEDGVKKMKVSDKEKNVRERNVSVNVIYR